MKVYWLRKALYGLKKAPRAWYSRIDRYFQQNGFMRSEYKPTLYLKKECNNLIIIYLYVDDIIYTSSSVYMIVDFREKWFMILKCLIWENYIISLVLKYNKQALVFLFLRRNMLVICCTDLEWEIMILQSHPWMPMRSCSLKMEENWQRLQNKEIL